MLIGLTGYAGSGKNTVADILVKEHGFKQYALADKLRELVYAQNPIILDRHYGCGPLRAIVDTHGWDYTKRSFPAVRELLQHTGVWMRENVSEDFWVDLVHRQLVHDHPERIVITDVRFANEARFVREFDGHVLKVLRPGIGPVNGHISEALDFRTDGMLYNGSTVEDLSCQVADLVDRMRGMIR